MNDTDMTRNWLFWLAVAALGLGLLIGLTTLTAPAGVWLGLWPFGTGFGILQVAYPLAPWIAIVCVLIAVALLILAQAKQSRNSGKLAVMAAIGALAAGLSWYIPSTFEGDYPPIHDVSTDVENPPQYEAVLPLRGDGANPVEYGMSRAVPRNEHARVQREAYPDLVTQSYGDAPDAMFDRALAAVDEMGWELVEAAPEDGRIEATATTFWFRFRDDIVIRIQPGENGGSMVDARSLSRVGVGDAGTNASRLREFFAIL